MKAVLFDLDGTLIDSIELIVQCFTKTIQTHLHYTPTREWIYTQIGKPLRPQLEELLPGHGQELIHTYRQFQDLHHDELVSVFPGIEDLIDNLTRDHVLGIVTSKGRLGTQKALQFFKNKGNEFCTIITADDSATHKPDAGPLLQALAEINREFPKLAVQPSECGYVGDTIFDMQAAISAKMPPLAVLWGVASAKTLGDYTADIAGTPSELEALIRGR